ncbi:hypothetical protein [Roseicitreum antarcticum]|uniref:hypothetical protein n=1 Tax=Roseicitreum antarcticum TaxID=564137 RepID=UPI000B81037E|nr:hypothetical protein [Roseicitreum antarcticum]
MSAYAVAAVAVAASYGATWWHGLSTGIDRTEERYRAAQDKVQADLFRSAEALSIRALELEQLDADLSARAMEAEDAARRDPDVCRIPSPDSLRRLEERWEGR